MSTLIEFFKARELIHDISHEEELAKALRVEGISFYCGFDPTADSLHVGSMLPLIIMRKLQRAGHKPLVVLGSGTALIGDPSGKSSERPLLSKEEISKNAAGMKKQISLFLSEEGTSGVCYIANDEWLSEFSLLEFLRDVGKHFSVNGMMVKESVRARLEDREHGISFTEFSYMLLQAYDFYHLYHEHGCRLQIGGSDQWGNITAGLELIRRKSSANAPQAFGLTFPLLTTSSGQKFGKTEQGNLWLDPQRTSPYQFYQYWVNTEDADVVRYLKYFTDLEDADLHELEEITEKAPEKRAAQKRLAEELTTLVHGHTHVENAERAARILFGEEITNIDEETLSSIFEDVPSTTVKKSLLKSGVPILELLATCKIAKSKGEARRLVQGGGVYLNNQRINDEKLTVSIDNLVTKNSLVLRTGKKKYHLVRIT